MKKLLMVAGPVQIEQDILKISSKDQEYMRTDDYSEKWERIFSNLKYIFQTTNPVICFASSGTGAMDAAVCNFMNTSYKVAYINAGSFGKRWGDICNLHKVSTVEIPVKFGDSVTPTQLEESLKANTDIKAVFATLNETSCGALQDIKALGAVLKNHPEILFVVDCISGLCSDKFLMDEWGVDVAISASQKALALPPGLSFMAVSPKALKFAEQSNIKSFYFNIFDYLKNQEQNQTPFTPATCIVDQLDVRLAKIKEEGLENYQKRYLEKTQYLREKLNKLGFSVFAKTPVNCVTGVMTDKFDASELVKIMREKFNIEIAPSGGDLKTHFFRIGNYGDIGTKEIDYCIECIKKAMDECCLTYSAGVRK